MLKHLDTFENKSGRVVIVGAGGFIGGATAAKIKALGVEVIGISRKDIDLLSVDAENQLVSVLRKTDTLVFISAQAPVKNNEMLIGNLSMASVICSAIRSVQIAHLVYVSSDAVYADSKKPLTESSCAEPASLHGVMHLAREVMLSNIWKGPLCILRPTLVYGVNDPHNGYGPNKFRRLAQRGEEIFLYGDGEEMRDHVYIDDVAEIITRCVFQKSHGTLNIASGIVTSFSDVAMKIKDISQSQSIIKKTVRAGPIPHNGFRDFDSSATKIAFPDFRYTSLDEGLALCQKLDSNLK